MTDVTVPDETPFAKPTDELRMVRRSTDLMAAIQGAPAWTVIGVQRKWLVQDGEAFEQDLGACGTPLATNHHGLKLLRVENRSEEDEYPHREYWSVCKVREEWRDLPSVTETAAHAEEEATRG